MALAIVGELKTVAVTVIASLTVPPDQNFPSPLLSVALMSEMSCSSSALFLLGPTPLRL